MGARGRRGTLSLLALDAEFAGRLLTWTDSAEHLQRAGLLEAADRERVRWLEVFGHLIANTDMHGGNLSFFLRGTRVLGVCPPYDMTPMFYAPRQAQLVEREFVPPTPRPSDAPVWQGAWTAAIDLWRAVAADGRVSDGFRRVAGRNAAAVEALAAVGAALPRG